MDENCEPVEILLQFQSQGGRSLYCETYRNYPTLLTSLDNLLQPSEPTQFRFVVQRADNP